ncbi:MAG TPA: bifunctional methylenetetrahydrofolate dehydrogenase/methenyltetrahydrofolate cyclohydrolase FolD [Candidatus Anaerofilum excrementigallinarum]|nr:bifunctional methylenetetrahydrofolate dehydrogenase/methenyltetrahydrofolate cyclohydrolase FolD [Candidatus Anaerofilum excrementigallinarum]
MAAQRIEGKPLAAAVKQRVALEVEQLKQRGIRPCLAVILVGEDPASQVYVAGKERDCAQCGMESRLYRLPADITQAALLELLAQLAADREVHGILVQLPLPAQIDEQTVIAAIPPEKDVDGFTPVNLGRMLIGQPCFVPCTPAGCLEMIASTGVSLDGKHAVVVGRSNIVGKPAAVLLLQRNATVTVCHSRTKDLADHCRRADVLVAAVGKAGFITGDMVKPGAVVIDVGINRGADGKLCGDVDFAAASEKASFITPVPGGVGLMTRAMLMENTLRAAKLLHGIE